MVSRVLLVVAVCALLAAVSSAVSSESPLHRQHHVHQHHVTAHKFSRTHHTPTHASGALAVKKSLDTLARDVSRLLEEEVTLISELRTASADDEFPPRHVEVRSELDGVVTVNYLDMHDSCDTVANWMMGKFFQESTKRDGAVDWDALQEYTAYQISYKVSWTEDQISTAVEGGASEDFFSDGKGDYEIHNFVLVRMAGDRYYLLQAAVGHFSLGQWLSEDPMLQDRIIDYETSETDPLPTIANSPAQTAHQTFGQGRLFSLSELQTHINKITNAVTTEATRKEAVRAAFGFDDEYESFVTYKPSHTHGFYLVSSVAVPVELRL